MVKEGDCIALIGFMGAGKSAVGELLAEELGMEFVDLDGVIAREAGMSIDTIFTREGEDGFRRRERDALTEQLASGGMVLSCGGGVVTREENVEMLRRRCRVFLLDISESTAMERLRGSSGRPLLSDEGLETAVPRLMRERARLYRRAAHEIVDANEVSTRELAKEIAARWRKSESRRRGEGTRST
ncbi:MAG: shikimate kinase [Actinomycetota bacterium]|nr:shikimate kinase [Actinomycetota bacterium]MDD5666045.1 shikimate kinase [Actinomycetota bacterium]